MLKERCRKYYRDDWSWNPDQLWGRLYPAVYHVAETSHLSSIGNIETILFDQHPFLISFLSLFCKIKQIKICQVKIVKILKNELKVFLEIYRYVSILIFVQNCVKACLVCDINEWKKIVGKFIKFVRFVS